jgi:predicted transcriptional regulator YdeE
MRAHVIFSQFKIYLNESISEEEDQINKNYEIQQGSCYDKAEGGGFDFLD